MSERQTWHASAFAFILLCTMFGSLGRAEAATVTCPDSNVPYLGQPGAGSLQTSDPQCFDWQGNWVAQAVSIPSRNAGITYQGTVFAPANPAAFGSVLPAVVLIHGLNGAQYDVWWAARYLAGHGYVAIAATVTGTNESYVSVDGKTFTRNGIGPHDYVVALQSMADFLTTGANPYSMYVDPTRIGAAGHSEGARAASGVQDVDSRIGAIVAFDNLTMDLGSGDAGTAIYAPCPALGITFGPSEPITPRRPAMGFASDEPAATCPANTDPAQKEAAWNQWVTYGLDTMEIDFRGTNHMTFAQLGTATAGPTQEQALQLFSYYMTAWFDRYLKNDPLALGDLMASSVLGQPRDLILSSTYLSGVYLPSQNANCINFTTEVCPVNLPLCDVTYSGLYIGSLNISSGTTCISNGTITGNVSQTGGSLVTSNATITGNVFIGGSGSFQLVGTSIRGNLQVQGLTSNSTPNIVCGTNVGGNAALTSNQAPVSMGEASSRCGANTVTNNFSVTNNSAPVQVFDNSVGGAMNCSGNGSIAGYGDTAGSLWNQCSNF
jgi:dienelactone hydrolase